MWRSKDNCFVLFIEILIIGNLPWKLFWVDFDPVFKLMAVWGCRVNSSDLLMFLVHNFFLMYSECRYKNVLYFNYVLAQFLRRYFFPFKLHNYIDFLRQMNNIVYNFTHVSLCCNVVTKYRFKQIKVHWNSYLKAKNFVSF